jgi:integrase
MAHTTAQLWNLDESQWRRPQDIQELLRHTTFKVTADTYTQAVTPVKRDAQAKIAKLILADVPAAKPVTPTIQ